MNKQGLIKQGYKYIATQNNDASKMELWAKFNGYLDTVVYVYYIPESDIALEQTKSTISYLQLDMMAQMRDKMREDFLKLDVEYDKSCIWADVNKQQNVAFKWRQIMGKWKYKLENEGKQLRKLIDEGDLTLETVIAVYNQMIVYLKFLKLKLVGRDKTIYHMKLIV